MSANKDPDVNPADEEAKKAEEERLAREAEERAKAEAEADKRQKRAKKAYKCLGRPFWKGRLWKPGEITTDKDAAKAPHVFQEIDA